MIAAIYAALDRPSTSAGLMPGASWRAGSSLFLPRWTHPGFRRRWIEILCGGRR
jgi:hypothetical protein